MLQNIVKKWYYHYITCSLFESENENQIKSFLEKNKGFKILDINLILKKN